MTAESIGKHLWEPLARLAINFGHEVVLTDNPKIWGDIGFYCDDHSTPGNQRLSVITINGLDQDHDVRPNYSLFFSQHNWALFDLGLLPGDRWMNGFDTALPHNSIMPRLGVIKVGWPKSDPLFIVSDPASRVQCIETPKSILYAPQTEQDGKQSEVVEAVLPLELSLKIKHWEDEDYALRYPRLLTRDYFDNLSFENRRCENLSGISLLDPKSNFIDALQGVDILVTDQSSVIYEASLCGIPSISVRGWRHACRPCSGPQPSPDLSAVAEAGELRETLEKVVLNYQFYVRRALQVRNENFVNLGFSGEVILRYLKTLRF